MTDSSHEMPDVPWWSQPGTTAVLPTTGLDPLSAPPQGPTPAVAPPAPKAPRRKTSAVLLALALVVGGAAGGGIATAFDDTGNGTTTTLTGGSPLQSGAVTTGSSKTVAGTPEAAAATIGPSVVTIEVTGQNVSDTGSGIIIRDTGYILTNNHVVAAAVSGGTVHVTLNSGDTVSARIIGVDTSTDLAVIKVDGQTGLKAATFATSNDLKVGQAVLAVGAPLGLSNTVTEGIVSTLHRPVRTGETGSSDQAVNDAIQTDAAINPGNSGGALVNLAGAVVGVNSSIATLGSSSTTSQSGNIGVGFAIPSETASNVAAQLIASGKAVHAQLGVNATDTQSSTDGAPGLGATIATITPGSPAQTAGLQVGDVVTKVDSRRITDADSLIVSIRTHNPGDTVTLTLTRGGATKTIKVKLGTSGTS
jgi:putative serine protease PepD